MKNYTQKLIENTQKMAVNTSNSSVEGITEILWTNPAVFGTRRMFYMCSPAETSFHKIAEVPQYVDKVRIEFLNLSFNKPKTLF